MIFDEANFPDLPESWTSLLVEDACDNISVKQKTKTDKYLATGRLAVVDQGAKLIGGYINNMDESVTADLPVIIFGDHTRAIKYIDFPFAAGADGIKVLKPKEFYVPKLFCQFLRAIRLPNKGYARHFQFLRSSKIALPPLNEQKRIAEKLDSLLARVDSCQTHLERVPQILKRFRQSVLAAATSGRLTEDWREEHGVNGEWESCALGDVLTDIKYGTSKKSIYELKNGIPVLRIPNIKDGKIDATDLKFSHFDEKEIKSLSLKTGDLLLIRSNGSVELVGKVAIVDSKFEGFMYAGYLIRLRFDTTKVNPLYLSFYLSSPAIRSHIELTARSTSGVNNINSEEVKAISLELPSLEEQAEIVRRVEKLFAYAERLEARYDSTSEHVERLTPSLLAKAFRGELVSQDPNDEPASVLLERIQEAKKTAVAKPRVYVERSKRIEVRMLKRNEIQTNHLSAILLEHGAMTAEALWSASQLEIDEFYDQLKDEEAKDLLHEVRGEDENSPRLLEAL